MDFVQKKEVDFKEFKRILEVGDANPGGRNGLRKVYDNIKQKRGSVTTEDARLTAQTIVAQDYDCSW